MADFLRQLYVFKLWIIASLLIAGAIWLLYKIRAAGHRKATACAEAACPECAEDKTNR